MICMKTVIFCHFLLIDWIKNDTYLTYFSLTGRMAFLALVTLLTDPIAAPTIISSFPSYSVHLSIGFVSPLDSLAIFIIVTRECDSILKSDFSGEASPSGF